MTSTNRIPSVDEIRAAFESDTPTAPEAWFQLCYDDLRRLAGQRLAREAQDPLLQETALVHEAWLKLGTKGPSRFENTTHFFAAVALTMRHILIDWARRKRTCRHGGGKEHVALDDVEIPAAQPDSRQAALDEALDELAAQYPLKAEVVRLRYLAGMTIEQVAKRLDISAPTARRHWNFARAWLYREIREQNQTRSSA